MEERRAALACQKNLQDGISAALKKLSHGQSSPVHTISSLQSALHEVDGLGSFFSLYLDPQYYNERRSDDCTAAQRTFDVPELLEMILDAAEIPDILSMYSVNRSIRDSIECSSRMQTKLCLRAAPAHSHLETPLSYCFIKYFDCERTPMACYPPVPIGRGFSCSIGRLPVMPLPPFTGPEDDEKSRTVTLNAYFYPFKQQRLGGLGSRIRRMFICQPPIKRMTVHLSCCPNMDIYFSDPPPPAPEYVSSEIGLTIGDLYDCAARLMDQHRWCPYAHAGQLDDDGMVDNAVQFQASVVLSPEDPLMLSCRVADASMDAENKHREMRKAKLTVYTNAKRQGEYNYVQPCPAVSANACCLANSANEPIPTMQEFEAGYHEDTDWVALAYREYPQDVAMITR